MRDKALNSLIRDVDLTDLEDLSLDVLNGLIGKRRSIIASSLLISTLSDYLPWSITVTGFGPFLPDVVANFAKHEKLKLFERVAAHIVLLDDLGDSIAELILSVPNVLFLHHVLVVRADLLNVQ